MGPQLWSVSAIATELSVTHRRVARAVADIEPAKIKGKRKFYWLRDVVPRLYGAPEPDGSMPNAIDLATQKARQYKEMADKLAMENARRREELVDVEETAQLWQSLTTELRQRLMMIPARVADQVARAKRKTDIKAIIDREVRNALASLTADRAGIKSRS